MSLPVDEKLVSERLPRSFPWGIRIADLVHPVHQTVFPGLLPTAMGGLLVSYSAAGESAANTLVEHAVASILHELPFGLARVGVMDLGYRKRFNQLAKLPSRLYEICNKEQDVSGFLAQIDSDLRRRYHTVLGDEFRTISDFNRDSPFSEKYTILVVDLDSILPSRTSADALSKILRECLDGGYFPILMSRADLGSDSKTALLDPLSQLFPEILVEQDAAIAIKAPISAEDAHKFAALCEQFQLALMPAAGKAAELVAETTAREKLSSVKDFLSLPIGRTADGRAAVNFSLGNLSGCYNAFIMGVPGMGKTSLLNNLIVQIAEQFTSREIQLYLMDYKDGTEFQVFDTHPNCKRIHLNNADLQAAESLLQEFSSAMSKRAQLFKAMKQDIKDIDHFNALNPENPLPRLFLIIDEVQCLLTGKSGSNRFADLLKDVVKRGRSFGAHIILSTQTLSGFSVDAELMSQIGLRIGFKLSLDSDCTQLLEFGNTAPRQLDKHQIIYNGNFGLKHSNVFAYTDNVGKSKDIRARINKVLAERDPVLVLTPEITLRDDDDKPEGTNDDIAQQFSSNSQAAAMDGFDSVNADVEAMLERERIEDEAKRLARNAATKQVD